MFPNGVIPKKDLRKMRRDFSGGGYEDVPRQVLEFELDVVGIKILIENEFR